MPLGVEHKSLKLLMALKQIVFKPLMPLGVEHDRYHNNVGIDPRVFKPLMPLGVEHGMSTKLSRLNFLCLNL